MNCTIYKLRKGSRLFLPCFKKRRAPSRVPIRQNGCFCYALRRLYRRYTRAASGCYRDFRLSGMANIPLTDGDHLERVSLLEREQPHLSPVADVLIPWVRSVKPDLPFSLSLYHATTSETGSSVHSTAADHTSSPFSFLLFTVPAEFSSISGAGVDGYPDFFFRYHAGYSRRPFICLDLARLGGSRGGLHRHSRRAPPAPARAGPPALPDELLHAYPPCFRIVCSLITPEEGALPFLP